MSRSATLRLIFVVLLMAALLAAPFFLPVNEYLRDFLQWVQGFGAWGLVLLAAFYTPACLLLIPGSLVTLAGGTLFGLIPGTIAISIGSTIGACAAFLVGRGVARRWVEAKVSNSPRFRAIDQAIGQQGFKIVLLLRLSPVFPFNLLNYALSLTRVRFRDYALASWIGMFPGTVMYVYLGSTLGELSRTFSGEHEGGIAQRVFFFVGLAVTVIATIYVTRIAKRALDRAIADAGDPHERADPARRPA